VGMEALLGPAGAAGVNGADGGGRTQ